MLFQISNPVWVHHLREAQLDASLLECFRKLLQLLQITGLLLGGYRHVFGHLQVGHVHVRLHRWSGQTSSAHSLNMQSKKGTFDWFKSYRGKGGGGVTWERTCGARARPGWCWCRSPDWLWPGMESIFCCRRAATADKNRFWADDIFTAWRWKPERES